MEIKLKLHHPDQLQSTSYCLCLQGNVRLGHLTTSEKLFPHAYSLHPNRLDSQQGHPLQTPLLNQNGVSNC